MTKKFFKDWQQRIGETAMVYVYYGIDKKYSHCLFYPFNSKITNVKFDGEYVTIYWDEKNSKFNPKTWGKSYYIGKHSKTLHRTEIETVWFIEKYNKYHIIKCEKWK